MKPKLVSFKLCPFVQKAVLCLLVKRVDFDIEYIDLENPPDWFNSISPLGKVPVLRVEDQILFESSVIVEYLEEVYGNPLHPADPLRKAQNRSWMEFANECLMNGFNLIMAPDKAAFNTQREAMQNKFQQLEKERVKQPFFNGTDISLVDLCFIPFFQRQLYLNDIAPGLLDESKYPGISNWAKLLLDQPVVAQSAVADIRDLYFGMIKNRGGYLSTLIDRA